MKIKYNLNLNEKYILVIQHPVTSEKKLIKKHINNIFEALKILNTKYFLYYLITIMVQKLL